MNIDFLFILTALTFISGLIYLIDRLWWAKTRQANHKEPLIVEYSRSFFPVFLIVLLIRSFIGQIYNVPSGSLEPTVMPGDFMLVTQYNYGLRLPVWGTKIVPVTEPKRGEIVVFAFPVDPKVNFVKRVIGLPGDKISYINGVFYINGKEMKQTFVGYTTENDPDNPRSWPVKIMQEDLDGVKHQIYLCADPNNCPSPTTDFYNLVVPPKSYFMIGDNRNNSEDSRSWGFVPEAYLSGKAQFILFSWQHGMPVFNRIGKGL